MIRRQDTFSAPAFEAYANTILCVVEALAQTGGEDDALRKRLLEVSDYFHMQANLAYDTERKFPD